MCPTLACITGKEKQIVAAVLHHHREKRWNPLAENWLSPLKMRGSLSKNIIGPLLTLSFRRISYVVMSALNFNLLDWEWIHSYSRICEGRQQLTWTCYPKESINNCYFSVAVSQRLQPSLNPCCSKVPFDELKAPLSKFVLEHTWFNCPCTGNKTRLTCCCDINENITSLRTPLESQHSCVLFSE